MTNLPWHFEAFRRYITYETMQPAASVLSLYEGEILNPNNPKMPEMLDLLQKRTGQPWLPERAFAEEVNFNVEGDIFRNKGRLLASFFITHPKIENGSKLRLLEFGKKLGEGLVNKQQYFNFLITHYSFPHPAFEDNWNLWKEANRKLFPLAYLLQILVELHETGEEAALSTAEVASFAFPTSDHSKVEEVASEISSSRKKVSDQARVRSDEIDRKIADMIGFLCMSGYAYYDGQKMKLNLMGLHPEELTYFWNKRGGGDYKEINRLKDIKQLIELTS